MLKPSATYLAHGNIPVLLPILEIFQSVVLHHEGSSILVSGQSHSTCCVTVTPSEDREHDDRIEDQGIVQGSTDQRGAQSVNEIAWQVEVPQLQM